MSSVTIRHSGFGVDITGHPERVAEAVQALNKALRPMNDDEAARAPVRLGQPPYHRDWPEPKAT